MRIHRTRLALLFAVLTATPALAATPPCDDEVIQAVVLQTALEDYGFSYNGADGEFYFAKQKVEASAIDSILEPSLDAIHERKYDAKADKLSCSAEFVTHFDGAQVASLSGAPATGLTAQIVQHLVKAGLVPGQTHRSALHYTIQYSEKDGISVMVGE